MKKLLNNPWFSATLALLAIYVVVQSVLPSVSKPRARPTTEDEPQDLNAAINIPEVLATLTSPSRQRDPFSAHSSASPDEPTQEISTPREDRETILLTAIWRQKNTSLVLINGSIQSSGSQIGRINIESIQPDGIWITHQKGRDFVTIGTPFTLSTPAPLPDSRRVAVGGS